MDFCVPKVRPFTWCSRYQTISMNGLRYIKENIRKRSAKCLSVDHSDSVPLASLRGSLRRCYLPLYPHHPSLVIMVVCCVGRILAADVGKTLMNMEMLKFLRARSDTRLHPQYQLECAFRLPSCLITLVSFPSWVCLSFEFLQMIDCDFP